MSEITSKNSCGIAPVSIPASPLKYTFNTLVGGDFLTCLCHNAIVLEKGAQCRETRKNYCMRSTLFDKILTIWLGSVTTVVELLVIS